MSHLKLEALARLVDEAPDAAESAHLAECSACSSELAALREQSQALATLPSMVPPPDAWPALRQRLRDEGIIRRAPRWWPSPAATRAAAAAVLFLAGGAAGWAARGPAVGARAAGVPVAESESGGRAFAADHGAEARSDARDAVPSTADAAGGVERAEEQFLAALDRFMASTGTAASDPAARLAALDNIVLTTAEALHEAPTDPVINSYYLMAQAQRRAVLRQIEATTGKPVF